MFKCTTCKVPCSEGAVCCVCNCKYDFKCGNITQLGYKKLGTRGWKCPKCKSSPKPSPPPTPSSGSQSPVPDQLLNSMQSQLNKISLQLVPLSSLAEDVKAIRSEMNDLRESLDMAHGMIDKFSNSVKSLEDRVSSVEKTAACVSNLQVEINKLKQEIDEKDQWARANNVEIRGIPMKKNENLYTIAERIGKIGKLDIKKDDINYIARVPTRVPNSEKPIIISFNNRYKKEEFVASTRQSKNLNLANLDFSVQKEFYVNDHLTQRNKTILNKTKALAREHHFRYVWVKHTKIMARKTDTSPILYIRNESDLKKIL